MSQLRTPKKPIPDWEKVRDEWVCAVEQLVADVESWCKTNDWPTRRIEKHIEESKIGEYVVPGLLIQVNFVKLMLEPAARFVTAADGVADLYVMPQYDNVANIIRWGGVWKIRYSMPESTSSQSHTEDTSEPFTARVFTKVITQMI